MREGNPASGGKSGAYDFSSADDFWKKLLDTPPQGVPAAATIPMPERSGRPLRMLEEEKTVMGRPPQAPAPRAASRPQRSSDFNAIDTGVDLQAVANAQRKSLGFVTGSFTPVHGIPIERARPDPWARGDRRLWWAAGGLMGLAVVVLTMFVAVSVGGVDGDSAAAAAATARAPAASAESPSSAANTATPGWRPMIPARVRGSELPARPAVKKHAKPRKGQRSSSR